MALTWMRFGRPLIRQSLGELGNAALAGRVRGHADASLEAEQRSDVDDFARSVAGDHVAGGELRELKDAGEVDLENALPVVELEVFGGIAVDGAGVVDKDVDAAKLWP